MTERKHIVRRTGEDRAGNHRGDFETCPNCTHRMPFAKWERAARVLILEPRICKAGSLAVMSECPNCFDRSWVHMPMTTFVLGLYWPKAWTEAAKRREEKVKLSALREWGRCLCHGCRHLTSGKVEFNTWRSCKVGIGPARTACDKFQPMKERVAR